MGMGGSHLEPTFAVTLRSALSFRSIFASGGIDFNQRRVVLGAICRPIRHQQAGIEGGQYLLAADAVGELRRSSRHRTPS